MRIQFGDTLAISGHPWRWWPAFAVIPHWNWRGEADYGTLGGLGANNGGYYTCWPGETNRCIGPLWRPRLFSIAQQRPDTSVFQWYGTLLSGKEDGAGLQYHRNRYVDPATGRFTQEDPLGLAGGINVYGFAAGDPVTFTDPFGLKPCQPRTYSQVFLCLKHDLKPLPGFISAWWTALTFLMPWGEGAGAASRLTLETGASRAAGATARVIGHHPEYLQVGEAIGAKVLDVPTEVWNRMTEAAQWAANTRFLDRGIEAGAEFVLATARSEIRSGSTLEREVNYLLGHGYKWAQNGMSLVPR